MTRQTREDGGAVAIVVAAFALVMFAFAAIVVDLGIARTMRSEAQTAADAAVFSGLSALYEGDSTTVAPSGVTAAVEAVKASVYANHLRYYYPTRAASEVSWTASATGTVPGPACPVITPPAGWFQKSSGTNCILFRPDDEPREMRVVVPSVRAPVSFGGAVGFDGITVSGTSSDGEVPPGTPRSVETEPSCVFCLLGQADTHDLQNGDLTVDGGDVWLNGRLELAGNGSVVASGGTVHVQNDVPLNRQDQVSTPRSEPTTAAPNPPVVTVDLSGLAPKTNPCLPGGGSGRYGGLVVPDAFTCTLSPGLYLFTEPIVLQGTGRLVGDGVTIYFACGSNGVSGPCGSDASKPDLVKTPQSRLQLAAPLLPVAGAQQGLALMYEDAHTATWNLDNIGAGDSVRGTIYGRSLSIDATSYDCEGSFRSMVAVRSMAMQGNTTCFRTTYVDSENIAGPTVLVPTLGSPVLSR